ncbi:unnamed protein product, partial [Allacma fusca]
YIVINDVKRDENVVDDFFGTKVSDPYRWLEDLDSNETNYFVEQQLELTKTFLDKNTQKEGIKKRLTELWNYPKITAPIKAGNRYFTFENSGLQPFYVIYVQDTLDGERRVFLDVNKLSDDGSLSLEPYKNLYDFSKDGEVFAYAVQKNGEDWKTIRFRNVSTGLDLPDKLENTKFPYLQWSPDNKGIFYTRLPGNNNSNPNISGTHIPMVYYHVLGTAQTEDILIAQFPQHKKYYLIQSKVTDDGNYLVISPIETFNENAVHIFSLKDGIDKTLQSKIVPVFPNATDAAYKYIGNIDSTFLFQTNKDASNFKFMTVTIDFSPRNQSEDLQSQATLISTFLPEHPKNVINSADIVDGKNTTVVNENTPALLWGYGGFAVSSLPSFSAKNLAFVDNFNGVYALANIRGGGEYGKKWYDEGAKLNKQNSFDDFQAAAEYLIKNNYTSSAKLTIEGESNGGLLVGACVNQHPELYGAAIVGVGVMDMLRINKTPVAELQRTIGGNPRQTNPLLLYVEKDAGHSSGKPVSKQIHEAAIILEFLAENLALEFKTSEDK